MEIEWISIHKLLEHEETDLKEVNRLSRALKNNKLTPIVVTKISGRDRYVILDGHHRFNALKTNSADFVPCIVVDYEDVELGHWRKEYNAVTKKDVIRSALTGKKFPKKTTKHTFKFNQEDYNLNINGH